MKILSSNLLNTILVVTLLSSLLFVAVTSSVGVYDPWLDTNDDGVIDMRDIAALAREFGTTGVPFDAKAAIEYDSGWINITDKCGQYFDIIHSLDSTDLIVDITGKTTIDGGVHQRHFGLTGYRLGWWRAYGGMGNDYAQSLIQTSDRGYAVTGHSWGRSPTTLFDAVLFKTDEDGRVLWDTTIYNKTYTQFGACVVQTRDGGYAVAGAAHQEGAPEPDWYDFLLVKVDSKGNVEWDQVYDGGLLAGDSASCLVETDDQGYLLVGYKGYVEGINNPNLWILKTNSLGSIQWSRTYGGSEDDGASEVVQTKDGGYAIAGYTRSSGAGGSDFWLIKTDATGNAQWDQTYGGPNSDFAESLVQTDDDGFAIVGERSSGVGLEAYDIWLIKTDALGEPVWNQTYGGTEEDQARSVIQTREGGFALAGFTRSFGTYADAYLIKTDSTGAVQWQKTYGGAKDEYAFSMIQIIDEGFVFAGATQSFATGENEFDTDFWLVKTDVESGLAWTDTSAYSITLYRGATDAYWNFVRVRIWKIKTP